MPKKNFFSGASEEQPRQGQAPSSDGWEDAFAGMQKLNLFDEDPDVSEPEHEDLGATQMFDLNAPAMPGAPAAEKPAAPPPRATATKPGRPIF